MYSFIKWGLVVALILTSLAYGQDENEDVGLEKENVGLYEREKNAFHGHLDKYITGFEQNYFLLGLTKKTTTKIQISIRYQILDFDIRYLDAFYLTYTMKAFWDIFGDSSPFTEYNSKPELMYRPTFDIPVFKELGVGLGHESAGIGPGIEDYPVNWVSLDFTLDLYVALLKPRYYFYFASDDINNTRGAGPIQIDLTFPFSIAFLGFNIGTSLRINTSKFLRDGGNITTFFSVKLKNISEVKLFFQHFYGYGESRISTLEKREHVIRLGINI